MTKNITTKTTDADYVSRLESTICELVNHSHLTVAFIEDLVHGDGAARRKLTGSEDLYYIPKPDVGALLYGVYELDAKLEAVREAYYAHGRAAKAKYTADNPDRDLIALCGRCMSKLAKFRAFFDLPNYEGEIEGNAHAFYEAEVAPLMAKIKDIEVVTLAGFAAKAQIFVADHVQISGTSEAEEACTQMIKDLANLAPPAPRAEALSLVDAQREAA